MKATITSSHPDAALILRRALENYATYAAAHAAQCRGRALHPGETQEKLDARIRTLEGRATAAQAMAEQNP